MIKIITQQGQVFDYYNVDDLNIRLNRIVDEYNDLEIRFSEFSYQFSLPKTNNNSRIFGHVENKNVLNKFTKNDFDVVVYLNSGVLFDGVLSLTSVDEDNYNCVLLSKVSLLIDELGEKVLREIKSLPDIDFDYENTIRTHVTANYQSSDETPYQFPFVFYSTYFTPPAILDSEVDIWGYNFLAERNMQNYSYLINKNVNGDNQLFFHQFPLAYYIKPVVEAILEDAGWSLSGTFFEKEEIKRIIIPYVGDNDIYDNSTYCSDGSEVGIDGLCSTGNLKLRTVNFLPEITQVEFLSAIINTFNLYFDINLQSETISFETYNDLFLNKTNPYVLDHKIDAKSVKYEKVENNNPSILFTPVEYNKILGDGTYIASSSTNALTTPYKKLNEDYNIYDYLGDGEDIEIDFGQPIIKKLYLRNKNNFTDTITTGLDNIIFIPQLTRQTMRDNNSMPFYLKDTDTVVNNEEDRIRHDGLPTLFYYYGISDSTFVQQEGIEQQGGLSTPSTWLWVNFNGVRMKIPFASPYAYTPTRTRINEVLDSSDDLEASAYASGMQSIYLMMGSGYTTQLNYSLVLSEQGDVYPTLYNQFHEEKYRRYKEGYVLHADMLMNILDWNNMKQHVPLKYDGQLYSLISIEDYDVVNERARIRMIRH